MFLIFSLSGSRFRVSLVACENPAFEADDKDDPVSQSKDQRLSVSELLANIVPGTRKSSVYKFGDEGKLSHSRIVGHSNYLRFC